MKVYACPEECPAPEIDFKNYDPDEHQIKEQDHMAELKIYLNQMGYTGPLTGKIFREPMADGYAQYMFADAPRRSCLIHLPYGDAWNSPNVQHLPKKEIVKRIENQEAIARLFAEKAKENK